MTLSRRPAGVRRASAVRLVQAFGLVAALASCNERPPPAGNEELKRTLDQLVAIERDSLASIKESAGASRAAVEEIRKLTSRVEALDTSIRTTLGGEKRGAVHLPMEVETACDNDALCNATARAVCNRVNYPNGLPSKFTGGARPLLNSVVCFD